MIRRAYAAAWPAVLLLVVVLVAWQLVASLGQVPAYILPSPVGIIAEIRTYFGPIVAGTLVTGNNALIGLLAGTLLAFVVALGASYSRLFAELMGPLAAAAAAIPIVAIAPLLYGMFSATGELPRRLVVTIVVFFPVFVNVAKGMRQVRPVHRDLMHSYAVSRWQFARHVQIPTALPYLFGGLRVAAPSAVIVSIVSEYFGGSRNGLATLITSAATNTAYSRAWAYVAASVFLGLFFFLLTSLLESIVDRSMASLPPG